MTRLTNIGITILLMVPLPPLNAACEDSFRPPLGVPKGRYADKDDSAAQSGSGVKPEGQKASRKVFSLDEVEGAVSNSTNNADTPPEKSATRKKKNRKKRRKRDNKKAESEEELRKRQEESLRLAKERVTEIRGYLNGSLREKATVNDVLAALWLKGRSATNTVTLLLGNHHEVPSTDVVVHVQTLVSELIKSGKRIIFDADSQLAPVIAETGGKRALGVTAHPSKSGAAFTGTSPILVIENPYLRMRALKENSENVVTDLTSITGAGLMVERDVTHVLDLDKEWQWEPARWKTGRNMSTYVKAATSVEALVAELRTNSQTSFGFKRYFAELGSSDTSHSSDEKVTLASPFPSYNVDKLLEETAQDLNSYRLKQVVQTTLALLEGRNLLENDSYTGTELPGGAVIFGSSSVIYSYKDLVYDTAWYLGAMGVPVTTGGAGGFMEVANRGAYDAGGHSIGIPIGGTILKNERKVMSDYHTLTVSSYGYESRIPLLLHRRKLVVIAPGSSGTLKELATTLVAFAGQQEITEEIVFLSSEYYGDLHRWLHWLRIPEHLKAKIRIIDSAEEIVEVTENLQAELGNDYNQLMTPERPLPRLKKVVEDLRTDAEEGSPSADDLSFEEKWKDWLD